MLTPPDDGFEASDKYDLETALRAASWRPSQKPILAPTSSPEKPAFVIDCPCCFALRAAVVSLTVKRMPFLHCKECNTRVFCKSHLSLTKLRERHLETVEELERLMALPAPEPTQAKPARRAKRKPT